jgi:hypothetical protein
MGPWCPGNISDDAKRRNMVEGGEVYDVDGAQKKHGNILQRQSMDDV